MKSILAVATRNRERYQPSGTIHSSKKHTGIKCVCSLKFLLALLEKGRLEVGENRFLS